MTPELLREVAGLFAAWLFIALAALGLLLVVAVLVARR